MVFNAFVCVSQGVPPATVAEFALQGDGNLDYYDGTSSRARSYPVQIINARTLQSPSSTATTSPCASTTTRAAASPAAPSTSAPTVRPPSSQSSPANLPTTAGPAPLKGPFDSTGFPVGCKSACEANLDGNQQDSANCCSGSHNTAATCPPSGVAYYSYFKGNCPNAYAYAYDESSGTALWTCNSGLAADYTITFCPPN